jgi:hypothetical protein
MMIPSRALGAANILRVSPLLTGISTLELRGLMVDNWLLCLIGIGGKFPRLQKLIIADYTGKGEKILQVAEIRQALLYGIKYKGSSMIFQWNGWQDPDMSVNPDLPRLFVEYCCQRFGFGEPKIEVVERSSLSVPLLSRCSVSLKYGGTRVQNARAPSVETAENICFLSAANDIIADDPSLWENFQKGELAIPQIPFKVELRNCEQIDPQIRLKLARHF